MGICTNKVDHDELGIDPSYHLLPRNRLGADVKDEESVCERERDMAGKEIRRFGGNRRKIGRNLKRWDWNRKESLTVRLLEMIG